MTYLNTILQKIAEELGHIEHRTKPLFVGAALLFYGLSLVRLLDEINPATDLNAFLIEALANLSIPFGIILLQELLELVTSISHSPLKSARRQFEIVMLVIVRSFFKNFAKLNVEVDSGVFAEPVQEAVVKVLAIIIITALIIVFYYLSQSHVLQGYEDAGRAFNLYKQVVVIALVILVLLDLAVERSFNTIDFISLIFTGLIVIDAIFLVIAILGNSQFDSLAFESSLVISLIFARFPLFTTNILAFALSVVGVAFATAALYLFYRSRGLALVLPNADNPANLGH